MPSSVITRKGQVTIPKAIRDFVDWREGERVNFLVRGHDVVMKRQHGTILDLKDSVKPSRHPEDFDDIRRQVERQRGARSAR